MVEGRQAGQDYFRALLRTVIGQALDAAGYHLQRTPLQWAGGKYRFVKTFADGAHAWIDFQVLVYSETEWSAGGSSRFTVSLGRTAHGDAEAVERSLSQLVVDEFGVGILPSADHWWSYRDTDSLAGGLAEAGHLIVGYGMPWLAGELEPPSK